MTDSIVEVRLEELRRSKPLASFVDICCDLSRHGVDRDASRRMTISDIVTVQRRVMIVNISLECLYFPKLIRSDSLAAASRPDPLVDEEVDQILLFERVVTI